jgi:hypothetical protein
MDVTVQCIVFTVILHSYNTEHQRRAMHVYKDSMHTPEITQSKPFTYHLNRLITLTRQDDERHCNEGHLHKQHHAHQLNNVDQLTLRHSLCRRSSRRRRRRDWHRHRVPPRLLSHDPLRSLPVAGPSEGEEEGDGAAEEGWAGGACLRSTGEKEW